MAFKHIRENITNTNTDQTIYTVPAGKEFVLTRKRARDASADHVGTVTFKLGTSTIEELSFSSSIAEIGEGTKLLCSAGEVIKARSTFAGAMAEAMGVEFKAGTWATVNESNPDSPDTPESSSSSSIEPEQSSSSSSQGGGDSTYSLRVIGASNNSLNGLYPLISGMHLNDDAVYYNGTYYILRGGTGWRVHNQNSGDGPGMYENGDETTPIGNYNIEALYVIPNKVIVTGASVVNGTYVYDSTHSSYGIDYVYTCSTNGYYIFRQNADDTCWKINNTINWDIGTEPADGYNSVTPSLIIPLSGWTNNVVINI